MSQDQLDAASNLLRNSPLDLGGDIDKMRVIYRQMLTAAPAAPDVRTSRTDLGGVPALNVRVGEAEPSATVLHFHGGCYAIGAADTSVDLVAKGSDINNMAALYVGRVGCSPVTV